MDLSLLKCRGISSCRGLVYPALLAHLFLEQRYNPTGPGHGGHLLLTKVPLLLPYAWWTKGHDLVGLGGGEEVSKACSMDMRLCLMSSS